MAAVVTNLIQGPGTLHHAPFGTAEPLDTDIREAPGVGWTDVGGTLGGVEVEIAQEFSELEVDQVVDRAGSRLTKRDTSFSTQLAEPTLENLKLGMNGGTITEGGTPGTDGWRKLTPDTASSVTQPDYNALLFDGWAPEQLRRRIVVRKVLNLESVSFAYKKDEQTVLSVQFNAHYVDDSTAPYIYVDEDAA